MTGLQWSLKCRRDKNRADHGETIGDSEQPPSLSNSVQLSYNWKQFNRADIPWLLYYLKALVPAVREQEKVGEE